MKDKKLTEFLEVLSGIVESHIITKPQGSQKRLIDAQKADPGDTARFSAKIDVIERVLEMLRIKERQLINKLAFSDFIQGDLEFKNNQIHFTPPLKPRFVGFGRGYSQ